VILQKKGKKRTNANTVTFWQLASLHIFRKCRNAIYNFLWTITSSEKKSDKSSQLGLSRYKKLVIPKYRITTTVIHQNSACHLHCISFRSCSVVLDWSPGLILSRITSLIYIDFDELE
jgi:hypothetical protein